MKIEKITYGDWGEAWQLRRNGMEMIVLTELGPRIMSFKLEGGENVLFEANKEDFRRGDWHLYGGHRFWLSPEAEHSYVSDNEPCEVEASGEMLRVTQRPDPNGMQKIVEIGPSPQTGGFIVNHQLRNVGDMLHAGAIWALTCVVPTRVVVPWGAGSATWRTHMVRYWSQWAGHGSNIASTQWRPGNETFKIEPTGEEGKVGLFSEEGFMAALRADCAFVKCYEPIVEAQYPDGGCNIELYTCRHFIELETLSPQYTFHPGREYNHTEHWTLVPGAFEPKDWQKLGEAVFQD